MFSGQFTLFFLLSRSTGPFKNILGAIRSASTRGISGLMENSMFATLLVFPVVLWGTVALSLIQQAGGVSTGNLPTVDPLLQFVELAIAPLREEIGFRVIPIGVVALIVIAARGKVRDGILALWHPSRYLKKNDTPEEYKRHLRIMYVMIAVSAILFGLAHVGTWCWMGPRQNCKRRRRGSCTWRAVLCLRTAVHYTVALVDRLLSVSIQFQQSNTCECWEFRVPVHSVLGCCRFNCLDCVAYQKA